LLVQNDNQLVPTASHLVWYPCDGIYRVTGSPLVL